MTISLHSIIIQFDFPTLKTVEIILFIFWIARYIWRAEQLIENKTKNRIQIPTEGVVETKYQKGVMIVLNRVMHAMKWLGHGKIKSNIYFANDNKYTISEDTTEVVFHRGGWRRKHSSHSNLSNPKVPIFCPNKDKQFSNCLPSFLLSVFPLPISAFSLMLKVSVFKFNGCPFL